MESDGNDSIWTISLDQTQQGWMTHPIATITIELKVIVTSPLALNSERHPAPTLKRTYKLVSAHSST